MDSKVVAHWNHYLLSFSSFQKDVYFYEEYVKLYETDYEKGVCFVCEEGDKILLFPYLEREFSYNGQVYRDFETAYGYGGPISNTDNQDFVISSLKLFKDYCLLNNYVAGFVRFHPLLNNTNGFDVVGELIYNRRTISIDLSLPVEEIWMLEIHTKNRNIIKKAGNLGLSFEADYAFKYLDNFISLYNSTMEKLSADSFFYFDRSYYLRFVQGLPNSFLGVVKKGHEVLSSAIFMYSGEYGHYHLSGSDKEKLNFAPNNYMLWCAAKELKQHNVKYFHLGGGTTGSENDSLFLFKRKFSRSVSHFYIGKMIINDSVYNEICSIWTKENPEKVDTYGNFLLKYKY